MSVSLLSGDITVYFTNDTGGDKQIKWTGSTANNATRTVNQVYSALMDLFDNVTGGVGDYMNEGIPMKAITPTQYDIGIIETNDEEPWFIDNETIKHLTGGTIETLGWTRTPGSTIGIVRVPITNVDIVDGDVGNAITHGDGDAGRLLALETDYLGDTYLYIRPDSNAAANNFDSTSGTLTCNGHTATQTGASTTGNSTWSNVRAIGTIAGTEQIYVAQDQTRIEPEYWPVGLFDRLFRTRVNSTIIDNSFLTVYIREDNSLYDHFIVDTSGGGTTVAPLSSSNDLNNQSADPISATGPGGTIVISFAGPYTADVNADTTNETYSIDIDCGTNTVAYVYEYLKYITGRGITTLLNSIEGQQYIGIDNYIEYSGGITGTVNIGDEITGSNSKATGYVVSINTTASPTYVTLADSEGTFESGEDLELDLSNSINTTSLVTPIAPSKQAPFGTFAGGRLFGAHGVLIRNMAGTDVNNYQVIDDQGDVYAEPNQRTFTITAIQPGTEVRLFTQTNLFPVAGKENVGGAASPDDVNFVQSGPDSNGLYSLDFTYIYEDLRLAAPNGFSTEVDGSNNLPIFVVAQSLNFQFQKFTFILEDANGSLQLSQTEDRQYF